MEQSSILEINNDISYYLLNLLIVSHISAFTIENIFVFLEPYQQSH
jgi:hypothetical protein